METFMEILKVYYNKSLLVISLLVIIVHKGYKVSNNLLRVGLCSQVYLANKYFSWPILCLFFTADK